MTYLWQLHTKKTTCQISVLVQSISLNYVICYILIASTKTPGAADVFPLIGMTFDPSSDLCQFANFSLGYVSSEMQTKFDQEKAARQRAEAKLLEVEKEKSELSVDLTQLKQQVTGLKNDLRMEIEKVMVVAQLEPRERNGKGCFHIHAFIVFFLSQAKSLSQQVEQEGQSKKLIQGDLKAAQLQIVQLKSAEQQLSKVNIQHWTKVLLVSGALLNGKITCFVFLNLSLL